MRFAEKEAAPVNDKLVLARVYLARGTREDARHALILLDQLAARGVAAPEAFNDTGVAQFELGNYEDAIADFTKALAKAPSYDEALFNRAPLKNAHITTNRQGKTGDSLSISRQTKTGGLKRGCT